MVFLILDWLVIGQFQFLINDFAEAIIIDGNVSTAKSTEIYNYLKGKWNI